ncbi:MAG: glycosyltransferase family 4 protein [Candidatus Omnitrophica bacterium]|nr:glycosyltransferase family 4 protein [Candidatus Omnitrophota bacterium]
MTKERWLIERLEEWWIRRANRTVGLSSAIVDLTRTYYKIRLNNIPIVANPIDSSVFNTKEAAHNKGYVLYVGRLEYRKGVQVLIRAIPKVLEKLPQTKFLFIGSDCGMKHYLLDKTQELGIKVSVDFIDQVSRQELVSYYRQSALCVVPSIWENHPYVVLEAMACGKPVIATAAGGIPEIVKDKFNGLLVPPGSVLSLKDSIVELLTNEEMRETLGKNARKYIEDKYGRGQVIRHTLDIYKGLRR